jgi:hypothetical protein
LKRHAGWLAVAFASLTVLLLVVVCCQASMLYIRGSRLDMGTVPAWIAALGTSTAAFGVLAVFGNLRMAQKLRLDGEAEQARLINLELFGFEHQAEPPLRVITVAVRNHSSAPVFRLVVTNLKPEEISDAWEALRLYHAGESGGIGPHVKMHVLAPATGTGDIRVTATDSIPQLEDITFAFTDAQGRRWGRKGSGQPVRISGTSREWRTNYGTF